MTHIITNKHFRTGKPQKCFECVRCGTLEIFQSYTLAGTLIEYDVPSDGICAACRLKERLIRRGVIE